MTAPLDMVLSSQRSTQPDVLFVARDRLSLVKDQLRGPADLVAEVISAGSRQRDRIEKRALYEVHGVKEYWLIDPEAQTVEVLSLEKGQYHLLGRWQPGERARSRLLAGFTLNVADILSQEENL